MEKAKARGQNKGSVTLRAAIAVIVFMFALFLIVLAVSILRARSDAELAAQSRAFAASQVVATNARWIVELSRQALGRIDSALGADISFSSPATGGNIEAAVGSLPGNVKSYVVAADGRTVFTTDEKWQNIDIRDREYFRTVADGAAFHVSPLLVSRLDGAQIFVFSRRLERGGSFVGAAIISFDVSLLIPIWESLGLDELSTISFVREDGQLVARYPYAAAPLDLSKEPLFTRHLATADSGTYTAVSAADGAERTVGFRRVENTPLVAIAGINTRTTYLPFWRNTIITLLLAVPTALALAAAIIWIVRLLRKDELRRAQLEEALEHNRMLVRDTHHRVKNNLQAIMSLVRLHPVPEDIKADLQGRVTAMTEVHEHLYRLDRFTEIDASTLLPAIVNRLTEAFASNVTVEYDIDPLVLDRDQATPLALVVNEVVTNALKYAFADGRAGTIQVSLKDEGDGTMRLVVGDDGPGFDPQTAKPGLGTRLVKAMLRQLHADEPEFTGNGGAKVSVRFHATAKPAHA
ncbi:MAG: ATP-binding protein [Rhizobiaceae bacterium]|nr:ATP-binding protein [Rhizobiaceae bacterium]